MRELSPAQLARFTQIDYAREIAFIATRATGAGAETLGVARVNVDTAIPSASSRSWSAPT